jgi:hypothetical protein
MKYMMMVKLDGDCEDARQYAAGAPPPADFQQAMGKLIEKMIQSGVWVGAGGLCPVADGARIQVAGGKLSVTDGPYIESKEVIGGYAILEVGSKKEALRWGEEFMQIHIDILGSAWAGELEIRPMANLMDGGAGCAQP